MGFRSTKKRAKKVGLGGGEENVMPERPLHMKARGALEQDSIGLGKEGTEDKRLNIPFKKAKNNSKTRKSAGQ